MTSDVLCWRASAAYHDAEQILIIEVRDPNDVVARTPLTVPQEERDLTWVEMEDWLWLKFETAAKLMHTLLGRPAPRDFDPPVSLDTNLSVSWRILMGSASAPVHLSPLARRQ